MAPYATYTPSSPLVLTLPASPKYTHDTPTSPDAPTSLPTAPDTPTPLGTPYTPLYHLYPFWFLIFITFQLTVFAQLKHLFSIIVIFICCHFATDHIHKYVQFTR